MEELGRRGLQAAARLGAQLGGEGPLCGEAGPREREAVAMAACGEYRRAAARVQGATGGVEAYLYGLYTLRAARVAAFVHNTPLDVTGLERLYRQLHTSQDPHIQYLVACVAVCLDRRSVAAQHVRASIAAFPYNTASCTLLLDLDPDADPALTCLADWFAVERAIRHRDVDAGLDALERMQCSDRTVVEEMRGRLLFAAGLYDEAEETYADLVQQGTQWQGIDNYSHILYVKGKRTALSALAHRMFEQDPFAVDTCCVVGNYYSIKGNHDRAVLFFERATRLAPNYALGYTLAGHEHVERRAMGRALQSYRKAVNFNQRDWNAWYALGQVYEIQGMHAYALYYFEKAATLNPEDPRMVCAIAECHEKLGRRTEARWYYRQADALGDMEGFALHKLAQLSAAEGRIEDAQLYYLRIIANDDHPDAAEEGRAFLAQTRVAN